MVEEYAVILGEEFDHKFKKAYKKHRHCFEQDFDDVKKTILANLDQTSMTDRISNLGQEYADKKIFKTRMMITELRSKDARVVWHICYEKKEILFVRPRVLPDRRAGW